MLSMRRFVAGITRDALSGQSVPVLRRPTRHL